MNTEAIHDVEIEKGARRRSRHRTPSLPHWETGRFWSVLPLLLAVAGAIAWYASLGSIHPYQAGPVGLVAQLSILWWLGLALAGMAILVELRRETPRRAVAVFTLLAFALILHGTLPATESVPRFSSAYVVAGFSDFLGQTGRALPRLDVRMSWPALFAAAGMAARSMGVSTLWFLRWCPLVLNIAYLIPLKAIANTCLRTSRAQWAALAIFLASDWIDQDYFSPQGINLFLFLAAVAITVRIFAVGGYPPKPVQAFLDSRAWLRIKQFSTHALQLPYGAVENEQPERDTSVGLRIALLTVLLVILATSAVTHQITPAALCLVFLGLTVTGRTNLRMVWLFMAVLVWAWLSWEAHAYWSNHLSKVLGSAGQVGSTLNSTVAVRLQGTSVGRSLVEHGRLVAAALTWIGALAGSWALWRRGRTMWTMAIVGVAPIFVAGAVSYGGEVALRVLLFSLAPAAVLTASLIDYAPLRRASSIFLVGFVIVLLVLFPLCRFGNEEFEAIAPGDLAAATWIYAHVAPGAHIYVADRDEPLYYSKVGSYKLVEFGGLLGMSGSELADRLPVTHVPTYVYLTRSEDKYGSDYLGNPPDWLSSFVTKLLKTGYVHVVYRNSTAMVMRIEKSPPDRHPKPIVRHRPKTPVVVTPHPRPVYVPHPRPAPTIRPKPVRTTLPRPTRTKSTSTTTHSSTTRSSTPRSSTTTTPSSSTTTSSTTSPSSTTTTPTGITIPSVSSGGSSAPTESVP